MAKKKLRYVHVGTGSRAWMYITALMDKHSDVGELCALCDSNQLRMDFYNEFIKDKYGHKKLPTYKDYEFDKMIAEIKPEMQMHMQPRLQDGKGMLKVAEVQDQLSGPENCKATMLSHLPPNINMWDK